MTFREIPFETDVSVEFRVGRRLRCRVSVSTAAIRTGFAVHPVVRWAPSVPRLLSSREASDFRRGLDALFGEACRIVDMDISVMGGALPLGMESYFALDAPVMGRA